MSDNLPWHIGLWRNTPTKVDKHGGDLEGKLTYVIVEPNDIVIIDIEENDAEYKDNDLN